MIPWGVINDNKETVNESSIFIDMEIVLPFVHTLEKLGLCKSHYVNFHAPNDYVHISDGCIVKGSYAYRVSAIT